MASEYDHNTAFHYASYRPNLHTKILSKCLGSESFNSGLDIGCGTGQSSIALSKFCERVIGIDPSLDMLSKSISHSKVMYAHFDKTKIDTNDDRFEIITLAGSLWYAKSQQLLNEIVRVGGENSKVLVYDFQVLLDNILGGLGFVHKEDSDDEYNHQENFSGLAADRIRKLAQGNEKMQIPMTAEDLTHLVLSVKEQYSFLQDLYGAHDLYDTIVKKIKSKSQSNNLQIQADIFFTLYQLV